MDFDDKKQLVKIGLGAVILLLLVFIIFNSFTVVNSGTVKVVKLFGTVAETPLKEGFHIINPISDLVTFNVKEITTQINDVSIPAQDKFNSSADLTIRWSLKSDEAPRILTILGPMSVLERDIIIRPLISLIKEAGRSIKVSQDLYLETTQKIVEAHILNGLIEETSKYGITIHGVYLANIELDKVIKDAITNTKKLQEQEEQQKSILATKTIDLQRTVREAEAARDAEKANAESIRIKADSELYRAEKEAEALLIRKTKEAEANKKISQTLDQNIIRMEELRVRMKQAERWNGNVPQHLTSFGNTQSPVPLYHIYDQK